MAKSPTTIKVHCPSCQQPIDLAIEMTGPPKTDPGVDYVVTVKVPDLGPLKDHILTALKHTELIGTD